MATISSIAHTAPTFGNHSSSNKPKSRFRHQTQGDIELGRFERIKAYGSGANWKAGYKEAKQWFDGKSILGKITAVGMLAAAWALDFVIAPFTAGIWTVGKVFFPKLNVSGLGRAFHYGVQKSYELSKSATDATNTITH